MMDWGDQEIMQKGFEDVRDLLCEIRDVLVKIEAKLPAGPLAAATPTPKDREA